MELLWYVKAWGSNCRISSSLPCNAGLVHLNMSELCGMRCKTISTIPDLMEKELQIFICRVICRLVAVSFPFMNIVHYSHSHLSLPKNNAYILAETSNSQKYISIRRLLQPGLSPFWQFVTIQITVAICKNICTLKPSSYLGPHTGT